MKAVFRIYCFFRLLQNLIASTDIATTIEQKFKFCHFKNNFQGGRGLRGRNIWPVYRNGADWELVRTGAEGCQPQQQFAFFFLKSTQKPPAVQHLAIWQRKEFFSPCLAKNLLVIWLLLWGVCVMTNRSKRDKEVEQKATERECFFTSISLQNQ